MAFEGKAEAYLTCLPILSLRQQAVIRTWPARGPIRPGSVWSHVLFVDFIDLGEAVGLQPLLGMFRRPEVKSDGTVNLAPYREPIPIVAVDEDEANLVDGEGRLTAVLWASYDGESHLVRADDPAGYEEVLVAVWEQQWPRLRRSFRFRTRYRVALERADAFNVQVVERLARGEEEVHVPDDLPPSARRLADDLRVPDRRFRVFLRRYGAESRAGYKDVGPLVDVYERLSGNEPARRVPRYVWQAFPAPDEMSGLKEDLFGPAGARQNCGA